MPWQYLQVEFWCGHKGPVRLPSYEGAGGPDARVKAKAEKNASLRSYRDCVKAKREGRKVKEPASAS